MAYKIIKAKTNFTPYEETVLLELVGQFKNIVESKNTDARTNDKKKKSWEEITVKFNSAENTTSRISSQLLKKWQNMKGGANKSVAAERRERKKIGGGPSENCLDENSTLILAMLPNQIKPLVNEYDSDALFLNVEARSPSHYEVQDTGEKSEIEIDFAQIPTSTSIVPYMEKCPTERSSTGPSREATEKNPTQTKSAPPIITNTPKGRKRDRTSQQIIVENSEMEHEEKMKILDSKLKFQEKKIKLLTDQHNLQVQQQKELHVLQIQQQKEQHDLQMEILQLEKSNLLSKID